MWRAEDFMQNNEQRFCCKNFPIIYEFCFLDFFYSSHFIAAPNAFFQFLGVLWLGWNKKTIQKYFSAECRAINLMIFVTRLTPPDNGYSAFYTFNECWEKNESARASFVNPD